MSRSSSLAASSRLPSVPETYSQSKDECDPISTHLAYITECVASLENPLLCSAVARVARDPSLFARHAIKPACVPSAHTSQFTWTVRLVCCDCSLTGVQVNLFGNRSQLDDKAQQASRLAHRMIALWSLLSFLDRQQQTPSLFEFLFIDY